MSELRREFASKFAHSQMESFRWRFAIHTVPVAAKTGARIAILGNGPTGSTIVTFNGKAATPVPRQNSRTCKS